MELEEAIEGIVEAFVIGLRSQLTSTLPWGSWWHSVTLAERDLLEIRGRQAGIALGTSASALAHSPSPPDARAQ